jgi:hypothetical protein
MHCYCCDTAIKQARKVKMRPVVEYHPSQGGPDSGAYKSYVESMTFRWAVICQACYSRLDSEDGTREIIVTVWNLAGASRGDKAATIDEATYLSFQRREAAKLGMDL